MTRPNRQAPATAAGRAMLNASHVRWSKLAIRNAILAIEAETSVPAHIHDSDKCDECYEIFEEALRD